MKKDIFHIISKEKEIKMKIKTKLATAIMSLVLVFGLLAVGVYALDKAEVNLGGNLTFSASGVYAKVTGVVSGAVEDVQDKTVTFDNGSADAPVNWNEDLSFDGGEEITYNIMASIFCSNYSFGYLFYSF